MASAVSQGLSPSNNTRLFYCHRCLHEWRKSEDTLCQEGFLCPNCQEGFIEDITENNTARAEDDSNEDPVSSTIRRLLFAEYSPLIDRPPASSARARSRSPQANLLSYGPERRAMSSISASSPTVPRLVDFHFDLDDFMTSLLSSPRPSPISQRTLSELPIVTYTDELLNMTCSVCFEEFIDQEDSRIRRLPCRHLFHELCIYPWLRISGTCPVCRSQLPRREGEETNEVRDASRYDNLLRLMRHRRQQRLRHLRPSDPDSPNADSPPSYVFRARRIRNPPPRRAAASFHRQQASSAENRERAEDVDSSAQNERQRITGQLRRMSERLYNQIREASRGGSQSAQPESTTQDAGPFLPRTLRDPNRRVRFLEDSSISSREREALNVAWSSSTRDMPSPPRIPERLARNAEFRSVMRSMVNRDLAEAGRSENANSRIQTESTDTPAVRRSLSEFVYRPRRRPLEDSMIWLSSDSNSSSDATVSSPQEMDVADSSTSSSSSSSSSEEEVVSSQPLTIPSENEE